MERRRIWKIGAVIVATLLVSSCAGCPQDPDGTREGANPLALNRQWSDSLSCGADCADWYRVEVPSSGTVAVDVESTASSKSPSSYTVELWSGDGRRLDSKLGNPGRAVQVRAPVPAGTAYTVVRLTQGDLGYTIRARLLRAREPAPAPREPAPPPPPRTRDVTGSVIEVEGHGASQKVLIDKGKPDGIQVGQRGRLVDGGRKIADIEIIQVFPDGSRARMLGKPSGVIKGSTRAVVKVPVR